ncbi:MAG TPA: type II toxin-antitoxin system prevent-host-death family antitoxin [Candidatus Acidoferrales bacterium]|nr:type II toxin-antitoxin system prevent-host-death family antitoxin [Candidatus Acidoferrales bacterium]
MTRVERGEEIIITRHGKPIARLIPDADGMDRSESRDALDRIRERANAVAMRPFDWSVLKNDRDLGRP